MEQSPKDGSAFNILFIAAISILILQRFFHLTGAIEEPMAWRQFDTEFFAYDYFKNGIDLFKPSVSWMGAYRTTILEFPLISAVIALFYDLFTPDVLYARIVIFMFYLGSAFYLYRMVLFLYYRSLACFTLLAYLLLPLGIYYSRAVNIDFPVLFFSLSALYYFLKGFDTNRLLYIVIASVLMCLGALVKAPYILILSIPMLYFIIKRNKLRLALKVSPLLLLPALLLYFWQTYAVSMNAAAPEWGFIPGYFKFTDMSSWYFGSISDRFVPGNWEVLIMRFGASGITFAGLPLLVIGVIAKLNHGYKKNFIAYYSIGIILYLLVFFKLNVIHDYYQVPLLVVTSFFIAAGIDSFYRRLETGRAIKRNFIIAFVLVVLMINGIWFTERWYYRPDNTRHLAADFIRSNTNENDLVITSIDLTDPRDPRILAPAHRYGWSIRKSDLNPDLIEKLRTEGAKYLSLTEKISDESTADFLKNYPFKEFFHSDYKNRTVIYKLNN
jgi:Dolichyl-phosphate-mannose-protein mannosyltransferase